MDSDRPSPLEPGYIIDRYELLYALAQGGMGSVWVARLQGRYGFEKLYAVKTILPKYAADSGFRAMFLDEARIASAIDHPNVVPILNLDEQHGILYQIMEYVEGDSILRLLRSAEKVGTTIPLGVALRIVADTCAGLHAAHELVDDQGRGREVVHRDVTPHNVLVSVSGVAKVIDFGIAKARNRIAGETSEGVLKGKIRYAAPEQVLGKGTVDRRADVWGAAAVLRVMLTGKAPYAVETDMDVLRCLLAGDPPAPLPSSIPAPVAAALNRGLQPDRNTRYSTALEFAEAIERAMAESGATCSTGAVGVWVKDVAKKRIDGRRESLELALAHIAERARVRAVLERRASKGGTDSSIDSSPRGLPTAVELIRVHEDETRTEEPTTNNPVESTASVAEAAGVPRPARRARVLGVAGIVVAASVISIVAFRSRPADSHAADAPPSKARTSMIPDPSPVDLVTGSNVEIAPAVSFHSAKESPSATPSQSSTAQTAPVQTQTTPTQTTQMQTTQTATRVIANAVPRESARPLATAAPTAPPIATSAPEGDSLRGTIDSRK